jgi:hypothetical protein
VTDTLIYSNQDFPEVNITTIGRWIENEKVTVLWVNTKGETKKYERRVYFDTHDLFIKVNNMRYYYSEFDRI